jgi:threonine/homoserine/homoserine lactone efflux protein
MVESSAMARRSATGFDTHQAERGAETWRMLGLSAVFIAMSFVVFTVYGACAGYLRARPHILARLRKAFAASFAVLARRLVVGSR